MFIDAITGRVLTVAAPEAVGPFSFTSALKFDATGRVVVTSIEPIVVFANGLPFDADGNLCIIESSAP